MKMNIAVSRVMKRMKARMLGILDEDGEMGFRYFLTGKRANQLITNAATLAQGYIKDRSVSSERTVLFVCETNDGIHLTMQWS